MNEAQITGSVSSYARKYALNGLFLIDDNREIDSLEGDKEGKKTTTLKNTTPTTSPESSKSVMSEAEIKRLYTIASIKGYPAAKVKKTMQNKFKITSANDLTKAQYNTMVTGYEGLPDKESVK